MTPRLKDIVYECIASRLDEMTLPNWFIKNRNSPFLSTLITISQLDSQAHLMGYYGSLTDLVNLADGAYISNENNEFEERVITPIKRAQGIYY